MLRKKILLGVAAVLLAMLALTGPVLAGEPIKISVNGVFLAPDVPPQVVNGSTMVPLRFVSETLGAQVGWDGASRTAIVRKDFTTSTPASTPLHGEKSSRLKLEINGRLVENTTLVQVNGRVMVPLRLISETFGAQVNWDGASRVVYIVFNGQQGRPAPLDLLLQASQKQQEADLFGFNGDGYVLVSTNTQGLNLDIRANLTLTGAYRKPGQLYLKMLLALPEGLGDAMGESASSTLEYYVQDDMAYTREDGGAWESSGELALEDLTAQFTPDDQLRMVQDMGVQLEYGQDAEENGRKYYVLQGRLEGAKLLDFVSGYLSETSLLTDLAEAQGALQSLTGTLTYRIDAGSLQVSRAGMDISMTMDEGGMPMTIQVVMNFNYINGAEVNMPEITLPSPAQTQ